MPQEYTPSGSPIAFTVPAYADVVDGPVAFKAFADDLHTGLAAKASTPNTVGQLVVSSAAYTPASIGFDPAIVAAGNANQGAFRADGFLSTAGRLVLNTSSGVMGAQGLMSSGTTVGEIRLCGSDGTGFIRAATIAAAVDNTSGTNDMPGRLVFATTADGGTIPTERMRIDSNGLITGSGTTLGAWTSYTPTLGSSTWTLGNGTASGRYVQIGKTVHYWFTITFGSTSTFAGATNALRISLPSAPGSASITVGHTGAVSITDASIGIGFAGRAVMASGGGELLVSSLNSTNGTYSTTYSDTVTSTVPMTWTTSDAVTGFITYQVA